MSASWWFLLAAVFGAWFTKQALWPVRLPARRAIPGFFAAWLTNELILHHVAWQVIVTVIFVTQGALDAWPGWVGLALVVAQWAGAVVIFRRVLAAGPVLAQAVEEATGEPIELRGVRGSHGITTGQLLVPLPPRHRRVERLRDITFARAGGRDLKLDVYRSRDTPTGAPVVLYLHGGGWVISNKDQGGLPLMHEFAGRGWIGVNADYRLAPFASFPDHIVDVKRAIAWIREHIHEYGGDPSFIAITGGSAGGHLAALAALTANDARLQPGFEDADTSIQAAMPFYAPMGFGQEDLHDGYAGFIDFLTQWVFKASPEDDPDLWRLMEPFEHIHADAPPFLVIHGAFDTLASPRGSREFVRRLREVSRNPVGHAELPGTQHAFDIFPSRRTAYVLEACAAFAEHVRAQQVRDTA